MGRFNFWGVQYRPTREIGGCERKVADVLWDNGTSTANEHATKHTREYESRGVSERLRKKWQKTTQSSVYAGSSRNGNSHPQPKL